MLRSINETIHLFFRDKIETFIDENKALMKRMYGDFEMSSRYPPLQTNRKRKRQVQGMDDDFTILPELMDLYGVPGSADDPVSFGGSGDSYFGRLRDKRQSSTGRSNNGGANGSNGSSNGNGNGNANRRQGSTPDSSGESTGR